MDLAGVGQKGLAEPTIIGESTLKKWIGGIPPVSYEIRLKVYTKLAALLIKNAPDYKRQDFDAVFTAIHNACEPRQTDRFDELEHISKELWSRVRTCCDGNIKQYSDRHSKTTDVYYVKRAIEIEIDRFLNSDKAAMVIVGQSGMGKSTLLVRILREKLAEGHLCFFISSAGLPMAVVDVERHIVNRLLDGQSDPGDFWARINAECQVRNRRLIIGVDAVNEYDGAGTRRALAMEFLLKLDELLSRAHKTTPNVRYLVTSRPETWRRGAENDRIRQSGGAYYVTNGKPAYHLDRFTDAEAREAYQKYSNAYRIPTPIEDLTELTRYHLRDPLLLKLTCELHHDRSFPRDLDTSQMFEEYDRSIREQALLRGVNASRAINFLVKQMFGATDSVILRDAVALDWMDINSIGFFLVDQSVIRVDADLVRFVYDRYAEYLLSAALIEKIRALAEQSDFAQAAFKVLQANLAGGQKLDTVFGALRRTLRLLQSHCMPSDYALLVQRLAIESEHGMALVASVMAALAMSRVGGTQGIDTLEVLAGKLIEHNDARARVAFPIIDAVYRVLLDEEYRTWLTSSPSVLARHQKVLDNVFVHGMTSSRDEIWAAAIQYIFFLWQAPEGRDDAVRITKRIVESVGTGTGILLQGALVRNLANLILLIFAEARDETTAQQIAQLARPLLKRLPMGQVSEFIIKQLVGTILDWLISVLPNPVDISAVRGVFTDVHIREALALVLHLLRPDTDGDPREVRELLRTLVHSENGVVLELLSVALSTHHERLSTKDRGRHLAMIESLFFEETPQAATEYVCALALYHINYFGKSASSESLDLMGRMAECILYRRNGTFAINGKTYNFNIIGTYGRAIHRYRSLRLDTTDSTEVPLQFAIDALEDAKLRQQFGFYSYICENIGLLGTLTRPEYVFDVISRILEDLKDKRCEDDRFLPFPFKHRTEHDNIRDNVLNSLANMRVLYKSDVDRYLLDVLDDQRLFTEVTVKRRPSFSLAVFYSWTCEHLIFKLLTRYYDDVGCELLDVLAACFEQKTLGSATQLFISRLFKRLTELSQ